MQDNRRGATAHKRSNTLRITSDIVGAHDEQPDPHDHPPCYLYTMESSAKAQTILYAQLALSRVGWQEADKKIERIIEALRSEEDEDNRNDVLEYGRVCIASLQALWYTTVVDLQTAKVLCYYLVPAIADAKGNTVHTFIDRELGRA